VQRTATEVIRSPRRYVLLPANRPVAGAVIASLYSQAALVVTGILAARSLGPTDRGYLGLLLLLPTVLEQVGAMGLPLATTYFIASDRTREAAVLRAIRAPGLWQVAATTAVQGIVLGILIQGQPHKVRVAALATLPLLIGAFSDMYGKAILQGQGRYLAFNIFRTGIVSLYAFGMIALFGAGHATLVAIASVWVGANVVGGLTTLAVALKGRSRESVGDGAVSLREMLRFGLKGFLGVVSPVETFRLDQAAIGLFLAPRELGLYIVAVAFTNLPGLISRSVGMIALPQIANQRVEARSRGFWRFFLIATAVTGITIAGLEVVAGWLVPFFFGHDFKEAVPITRILLIGAFFYGARRVLTDSASGVGRPGLGSLGELTSWLVLLPCLGALVPFWGVRGVAAAMAISSAASLLALVTLVIRKSGTPGHVPPPPLTVS
jgi:O-antigen/teichoic acid export membrane protein